MLSTSKKHAELMSKPLAGRSSTALPGIGIVLRQRLASKGFEMAEMVKDQYLVLGKNEVRFKRWLHDTCGANNKQQRECHRAIKEWDDTLMEKEWIQSDSEAFRSLSEIVLDEHWLKNVEKFLSTLVTILGTWCYKHYSW
ncbi:unnamed protein product [Gadus morhua 'NCC']